jgi:hypothetical protein
MFHPRGNHLPCTTFGFCRRFLKVWGAIRAPENKI